MVDCTPHRARARRRALHREQPGQRSYPDDPFAIHRQTHSHVGSRRGQRSEAGRLEISDWLTGDKVSSTHSLLIASKRFLEPIAELTKYETEISAGRFLEEFDDALAEV